MQRHSRRRSQNSKSGQANLPAHQDSSMDRLTARPVARANHRRPPGTRGSSTSAIHRLRPPRPFRGRIGDHRRISVRLFNCQRALPDAAPVAQSAPDHGEPHMLTPPIRQSTSPPKFFGDPGTLSLRRRAQIVTSQRAGSSAPLLALTRKQRGAQTATRRRIPHFRPGVT